MSTEETHTGARGMVPRRPLFPLGLVVATPGARELAREQGIDLLSYLARHQCGDWGEVDEFDRLANDAALQNGARLLSAYTVSESTSLWVITEADRSSTTLLLPEDY